jgi:hypothetical protein
MDYFYVIFIAHFLNIITIITNQPTSISFLFNSHYPDMFRRLSASSSGDCHFLITRQSSYLKMAKINVKLNVDRTDSSIKIIRC